MQSNRPFGEKDFRYGSKLIFFDCERFEANQKEGNMKKTLSLLILCLAVVFFSTELFAQGRSVRGYTRRDGAYVQPHYRSAPDRNVYNNWSTRGNANPYTGQSGRVNPESSYQSPYNSNRNYNSFGNDMFNSSPSRKKSYLND